MGRREIGAKASRLGNQELAAKRHLYAYVYIKGKFGPHEQVFPFLIFNCSLLLLKTISFRLFSSFTIVF